MVAIARGKVPAGAAADYRVSDVRRLPLADGSVDAVIVSKLFQHVPGWEGACRELLRVLRPGGAFIHLAERGAFGNPVRRYFAAMAEGMGFADRFMKDPATAPLCDYYAATFERLFRALVHPRAVVVETACEACGADACRWRKPFVLAARWPKAWRPLTTRT